jgi:subtilase family protein/VCBS repeat protein
VRLTKLRASKKALFGLFALMALLIAAPALAAFPGSNPSESVRVNTPNDPKFDHCEPDDEQGPPTCSNVFDEQFPRFGFAPNGSHASALFHNPTDPHVQRFMAQNTAAGRNPLGQVPGVSADRAWKYSTGLPSVQIAIQDTGIRWDKRSLRKRVYLNKGELPLPQNGASTCSAYDCNGDGAFNVDDYANDPRVSATSGHDDEPSADAILDGSDLIAAFSDSSDDDGNGYVDDIAGWDFFDDDNDPYDASSYSSASNHGSGRAENAAEEGNENDGGIGVCPNCQIVPMRVWDTFVVDTNNFAEGALYAADNNIEVVEGAVGGLFNSSFARSAFEYAYRHGVFFAIVSSDLNTADHNIPTLFNEAFHVQGTVADVHGLGQNPPQQFLDFFNQVGVPLTTNAPIGTWYRNSGTTQYGGHAHIVMPAVTGSEATGQASGAAGLVISYARQKGIQLEPNEVKQLLTMTAFDVDAPDTAGLGTPDPAHPGWDQHFGYGLPDLGLALERIDQSKYSPEALITSPQWFSPLNVSQNETVDIHARVSAPRAAGYTYKLQWAPGIEPAESDFVDVTTSTRTTPTDGSIGVLDLVSIRAALDARPTGGSTVDPTAPGKGPGDKDPNEPAFTVRVVVTDTAGNHGEDRKMLFDYRDTTLHSGWAKDIGSGGEASPRMFDLNGDNKLDTIQADSSGELHVYSDDGSTLPSFNNGQPVRSRLYPNVHLGAASYGAVDPPREVLRTPVIGDIDGDMEPEIVDTAGEHVYAWNADGSTVPGFPVRLDPSFSRPQDRTRQNHVKRGFSASPVLADLNEDGKLDIVAAGLDEHVYAWDGTGNPLSGFPKLLRDPSTDAGAEIITTPAIGDITGDGKPDIVSPTQEFAGNPSAPPTPAEGGVGGFGNFLTNVLAGVLGGSGRVYALDRNGNTLPGWPTQPNGIVPDALPFVGPGVDHVMANVDNDPELEAIGNVASGDVTATNADGSNAVSYDSQQPAGGETVDHSKVINLFENPIAANIDGVPGPEIIKGGVTLNQVVNLGVAVGQNLPYNHVIQAWNAQTGASLPSFPQAVEDYQLLSSPVVADVSDSPGNEILVGTGLYYLRNFNVAGIEGTGFPKFTGGWIFASPAIGDVDGDGKLEITTMTREGNMFVWDTDSSACGTNDEWWTSRHDEWNTGAYGTDSRPPGTPRALTASSTGSGLTLQWTAPGDDWLCGTASKYRVITSNSPIEHPTDGTVVGEFNAGAAGSTESQTVANPGKFVAVLYKDENGNWGHLASTSTSYVRPKGATPFRASLTPSYKQCTAPNRTHGAPLVHPSCNPPSQSSSTLTVGTPDANGQGAKSQASLLLNVIPGDPGPPDEADVQVAFTATDVRCAVTNPACPSGNGSDYIGKMLATASLRITDKYNGPSLSEDGTVTDTMLEMPVMCVATGDATIGADCALNTTLDALIPGIAREGQRAIWQLDQVEVKDAGPNGTGYGAGCPSACGDGDEQTFMRQGVFVP